MCARFIFSVHVKLSYRIVLYRNGNICIVIKLKYRSIGQRPYASSNDVIRVLPFVPPAIGELQIYILSNANE